MYKVSITSLLALTGSLALSKWLTWCGLAVSWTLLACVHDVHRTLAVVLNLFYAKAQLSKTIIKSPPFRPRYFWYFCCNDKTYYQTFLFTETRSGNILIMKLIPEVIRTVSRRVHDLHIWDYRISFCFLIIVLLANSTSNKIF